MTDREEEVFATSLRMPLPLHSKLIAFKRKKYPHMSLNAVMVEALRALVATEEEARHPSEEKGEA